MVFYLVLILVRDLIKLSEYSFIRKEYPLVSKPLMSLDWIAPLPRISSKINSFYINLKDWCEQIAKGRL